MENNSESNILPDIKEFLNIYPPIILNNNIINDTKKYLVFFNRLLVKRKSFKRNTSKKNTLKRNSFKNVSNTIKENNFCLIDKAIEQQKNNIPRSNDIKESLKSFLYHSNLISKLKNYFSNGETNVNNNQKNFEENIKTVISKLADSVVIEKYPINKFVLRMNEIGRDCYFLISGKLSVLKPVEYQKIKISYNDYLIYLSNLYNNNEFDLLKKVLSINNRDYLKIYNLDKILRDIDEINAFIKSYCITKLNLKIKNNVINYKDINKIDSELKEFNFTFLDFNIDENEIEENIQKIQSNEYDDKITIENKLKNYILKIFQPSQDDIYNMIPYDFLLNDVLKEQNNNTNTAILFKYELFLYLYPGAFFGETALENIFNNRRNATIRTEEDCNIISLNQKLYGSILYESTKLIKDLDILFLRKNYFFSEIPINIFNKLYFPMFKLVSKNKNDLIFQQNSELKSIYFLKEGKVKFETYLSAIDIFNIIKYFIDYLIHKKTYLKISNDQINNLKNYYLNNEDLIYETNNSIIYKEKINEINKYEIYTTCNYESIGILEFSSLLNNYIFSSYVVSNTAKFFEINKENLNKIIKREKDIHKDYYKLIKNKILMQIKRLYYLKLNFLSHIKYKINQNFFKINNNIEDIDLSSLNNDNIYLKEEIKNDSKHSNNVTNENKNENNYDSINKPQESGNIREKQLNQYNNYIQMKKPLKSNKFAKYFGHYDYEIQKNNKWSSVTLRYTKYNEKYFINKRLYIKNKSNIKNKMNNTNLNNSDNNIDYKDIINTLISYEPKKYNLSKLSLKSENNNSNINDKINIGNNHIFTLEQLRTKMKKNSITDSIMNLSIVKNDINNKTINNTDLINKDKSFKLNFTSKNRHEYKFKKINLRKKIIIKEKRNNNISRINTLKSPNNDNYFLIDCIKKYNSQPRIQQNNKLNNNNLHNTILNKSYKRLIIKRHIF